MLEISKRLLKQRVRNRLIEALDSFAEQSTVSILGTDEIIESWYDWNHGGDFTFFDEPVFSFEEKKAILRFHKLLELTYKKIPSTWKLEDLKNSAEWSGLVKAAREEYEIFKERGMLDEEKEIT